jgi:enterochelin esterase-like enzyme
VRFASEVTDDFAHFRLAEAEGQGADQVRLWLDLRHDAAPEPMRRVAAGWELMIGRPPVKRLEYLFVLRHRGIDSMIVDPGNPSRTSTPFGDHSVLEFPDYRKPTWLHHEDTATRSPFSVTSPGLLRPLSVTICSPAGSTAGELMPLLAVHDGPEFDGLVDIVGFSTAMIDFGRLPRHRVALLGPGDRNRWYSALPAYADALSTVVIPAIERRVATTRRVLIGASLAGLAALHVATRSPTLFDGLFLQSGSFFDRRLDAHESSFGGFEAVTDFVDEIEHSRTPSAMSIGMTCGLAEENLANNERMAGILAACGNRVELSLVPDAHTFTGWRDALDPHLVDLLDHVWTVS